MRRTLHSGISPPPSSPKRPPCATASRSTKWIPPSSEPSARTATRSTPRTPASTRQPGRPGGHRRHHHPAQPGQRRRHPPPRPHAQQIRLRPRQDPRLETGLPRRERPRPAGTRPRAAHPIKRKRGKQSHSMAGHPRPCSFQKPVIHFNLPTCAGAVRNMHISHWLKNDRLPRQ